jgi:hypothetical protein
LKKPFRSFDVLAGDVTGDGAVTREDVLRLRAGLGSQDPSLDVNGDGAVDLSDLALALRSFGRRL